MTNLDRDLFHSDHSMKWCRGAGGEHLSKMPDGCGMRCDFCRLPMPSDAYTDIGRIRVLHERLIDVEKTLAKVEDALSRAEETIRHLELRC